MASKTFYECGCMEQGDQFFSCDEHRSRQPLPSLPDPAALLTQWDAAVHGYTYSRDTIGALMKAGSDLAASLRVLSEARARERQELRGELQRYAEALMLAWGGVCPLTWAMDPTNPMSMAERIRTRGDELQSRLTELERENATLEANLLLETNRASKAWEAKAAAEASAATLRTALMDCYALLPPERVKIVRPATQDAVALASPPASATVEIIVNGQPVTVAAGPIRAAIADAIQQSGQIGAPIDQWVLRTRDGEVIPHSLPDGEEFALTGGQRLFLHLGLPSATPPTEQKET